MDEMTPVIMATDAMLRSISPQSRTKVTPVATTASVATWARTLRRFTMFKKLSVVALKKTTRITSVANGARFLARRFTHSTTAVRGTPRFSVAAISFICRFFPCWIRVDARSGVLHE